MKCIQFVQCRSFASVVQSYNDNFELIVAEEALPDLSKYHAHFVLYVLLLVSLPADKAPSYVHNTSQLRRLDEKEQSVSFSFFLCEGLSLKTYWTCDWRWHDDVDWKVGKTTLNNLGKLQGNHVYHNITREQGGDECADRDGAAETIGATSRKLSSSLLAQHAQIGRSFGELRKTSRPRFPVDENTVTPSTCKSTNSRLCWLRVIVKNTQTKLNTNTMVHVCILCVFHLHFCLSSLTFFFFFFCLQEIESKESFNSEVKGTETLVRI